MTLKEIEDQLTDLEALPREAALVTLKLLGMDLFHELDAAWFEDAENQVKMSYWSCLYERATLILAGPPPTGSIGEAVRWAETVSLAEQGQVNV